MRATLCFRAFASDVSFYAKTAANAELLHLFFASSLNTVNDLLKAPVLPFFVGVLSIQGVLLISEGASIFQGRPPGASEKNSFSEIRKSVKSWSALANPRSEFK